MSQWPNHRHCCGDGGGVWEEQLPHTLGTHLAQSSCSQPHATTHKQLIVLSVLLMVEKLDESATQTLNSWSKARRGPGQPQPHNSYWWSRPWWNSLLWESLEAATASVILTATMTVEISVHQRSGPRLLLCHTDSWSVPVIILKMNNCYKSLTSVFLPLLKWYSSKMWISSIFDAKA